MSLAEGGHLTHGMALNMSGKWFKVVSYGLTRGRGDRLRRDGAAGPRTRPKLIIAGASAYSLKIDFARFAQGRQGRRRLSSWSTWRTTPG